MFSTQFNSQTKTWSGPPVVPLFNPNVNVGQVILTALARHPNLVGQISHDDGSRMLNSEIRERAIRMALNLRDLGLKKGDVIGIAAANSKYLASAVFGAFLVACPTNTLAPTFTADDIVHMFGITQPKLVMCDRGNLADVQRAMLQLNNTAPIYIFAEMDEEIPAEAKSVLEMMKPHSREKTFIPDALEDGTNFPAMIICSSGTTGPPKGVAVSHANLVHSCCYNPGLEFDSNIMCFSTLYWGSGVYSLITGTYLNLTRIITTKLFDPALMAQIIEQYKIEALLTPPSQLALLCEYEGFSSDLLDSVRFYFTGGSHVPPKMAEKMQKNLKNGYVLIGYAMTEVFVSVSSGYSAHNCGQLFPGAHVRVIDDDGNLLGVGEHGELLIKSVFTPLGYYNNEAATKATLIDGWIHSGDIGFFDESGYLHVVDRKKEIFKYNNYHITPSEIELIINSMEGVVMSAVVGIPHVVHMDLPAAVVLRDKSEAGRTLSADQIQKHVEGLLANHKWLRGGVYFVDEMPLTISGKIQKKQCREVAIEEYEKGQNNKSSSSSVK